MIINEFKKCVDVNDKPILISYKITFKRIYSVLEYFIDDSVSGSLFITGFRVKYAFDKGKPYKHKSIIQDYNFCTQTVGKIQLYKFQFVFMRKSKLPINIQNKIKIRGKEL